MDKHQLIEQQIAQQTDLPVLPAGIPALLKSLNDDEISYTELADKLEQFPSIAIKIVASANSAWASPGTPIITLRDSCARIGTPVVRCIATALSVAQVFDSTRCPAFDGKVFWLSALLTAEAADLCSKANKDICSDTARLAGLFHNIGLLWLASKKPQETSSAIALKQTDEDCSLVSCLTEKLGIDLYTAGGYLASYLKLPEQLPNIIASAAITPNDKVTNNDPLIANHLRAQQLAYAVIHHRELQDSNLEAIQGETLQNDPLFEQLAEKSPGIKSMAQALFSN